MDHIVQEFSEHVPAVSVSFADLCYEVYVRASHSHSVLTATCEQTASITYTYCLMFFLSKDSSDVSCQISDALAQRAECKAALAGHWWAAAWLAAPRSRVKQRTK